MAQSVAADSKNTVAKMRGAVVYFSRSGKTVKPYPEAYKPTTEVVKEELKKTSSEKFNPLTLIFQNTTLWF